MWEKASWIALPKQQAGSLNGTFVYYRTTFVLEETGTCEANVSANSRYRMWVNGKPVLSGPCRGDRWYTYYDTVDITPYLQAGKNVLAVQVLLFDESCVVDGADDQAALYSVVSHFPEHLLAVDAVVVNRQKEVIADLTTGIAEWKARYDDSFSLVKGNIKNEFMGAMSEHIDSRRTDLRWKMPEFEENGWSIAEKRLPVSHDPVRMRVGLLDRIHLYPRPIPLLKEEGDVGLKELGGSCFSEGTCTVAPHKRVQFLFTSDVLCNGYLRFGFSGGKSSRVTLHCFERFYDEAEHVKRDDYMQGKMYGEPQTDSIVLDGGALVYEPFWYRTLRFLRMDVETEEEALEIKTPAIRKTGYPLEAKNRVSSGAAWVGDLWDICLRTLESCMMDGYMDCPFWEQMQYPMDTRLQALFTYAGGGDIGLVKKALWEFHCSKLPCGLIQGKAPSAFPQGISTFSLYYIFMIQEYIAHTNDVEEIRKYLGDVDDILTYYDSHRESVYGLVGNPGYWPFVDWQQAWASHGGIPNALDAGPSAIINFMYAYALEQAACICESAGRSGMAEEYRRRKSELTDILKKTCYNEERHLYREGPGFEEYSQHAQSWAVLCGVCDKEEAARMMRAAFEEDVIPCSFSTSYELFRACEAAGVYELTGKSMQRWIQLLDEHCSTCPEIPEYDSRSECHAWSALPMYELVCAIGGVHVEGGTVRIMPQFRAVQGLPDISGQVKLRQGMLEFSYQRRETGIRYRVTLPENAEGVAVNAEGELIPLRAGETIWEENIADYAKKKQIYNPYLPSCEYVPDGEPHVFGERIYLYGSHDRFDGADFCLNDYVCYSADVHDLTDWRYEGVIYRKEQDPRNQNIPADTPAPKPGFGAKQERTEGELNGPGIHAMWAPDVVKGLDGRYYLYYCLDWLPEIAVAVCDTPSGKYEYLGLVRHADGTILGQRDGDYIQFDPGIFVDDDGTVYLYSGNAPMRQEQENGTQASQVMVLSSDMLTLVEEPKKLLPSVCESDGTGFEGHEFFEASSIRKVNGKYYFVYSSVNSHELCYAVSDRPDAGYQYGGTLVDIGDVYLDGRRAEDAVNCLGNTHGGMECADGQWYIFYHRQTNRTNYSRQGCAEKIYLEEDGSIRQAEVTSCGLNKGPLAGEGTYPANICCHLRSAKGVAYSHPLAMKMDYPYLTQDIRDVEPESSAAQQDAAMPIQYIANFGAGSVAGYKYFRIQNLNRIAVTVRGDAQGELLVRTAPEGEVYGRIPIRSHGSAWAVYTAEVTVPDGIHALYFCYEGSGSLDFLQMSLEA